MLKIWLTKHILQLVDSLVFDELLFYKCENLIKITSFGLFRSYTKGAFIQKNVSLP